MEKRKTLINGICMTLMVMATLGYLILGEILLPSENQAGKISVLDYSDGWYRIEESGEKNEVQFPIDLSSHKGRTVVFEKQLLKQDLANQVLSMWNRGNVLRVYIDGELRTEYDTTKSRAFGVNSPFLYNMIPLKESDQGKNIRIEMDLRNGVIEKIFLGDRLSILVDICGVYVMEMIFALIAMVLAIIGMIISIILRIRKIKLPQLQYFSLGTFVACVWIVTNSAIRQFFFMNVSVVRDIAFFAFALFPMFFAVVIDRVQGEYYRLFYSITRVFAIVAYWFMVLGLFTGLVDLAISEKIVMVSNVLLIGTILTTLIMDCISGRVVKYRAMAIGFAGLAVMGLVQAGMYLLVDSVYTGVALEIGLLFGLLCATYSAIKDVVKLNTDKNDAIHASKARGDFLANMSHEIRTPINAVLGMDEMILREAKEPEVLEYAENIKSAGTSLLALINDILDFSKIDNGKMEICPANYELVQVVNDVTQLLQESANSKGLDLHIEVDPHTINNLYGDDVRIKQIITNLMTNAVKYTEKGSVSLCVTSTRCGGNEVILHIAVKDTGIGIKKDDLNKLTEAFRRVDEMKNRNIEGTGLGLNITAQLLKMMGSELKMESTYGKGSTFFFDLKQTITDFEEVTEALQRSDNENKDIAYQESFVAPNMHILAVDDTLMNLRVFCALLKKTQMKITCVQSGKDALRKVQEEKFDMIFMDHMMPEMDGIETLHEMQKLSEHKNKDTKVIILTANALVGAQEMYMEEGFDDVLFKPVEGRKLEQMIMKHM